MIKSERMASKKYRAALLSITIPNKVGGFLGLYPLCASGHMLTGIAVPQHAGEVSDANLTRD